MVELISQKKLNSDWISFFRTDFCEWSDLNLAQIKSKNSNFQYSQQN